MSALIGHTLGQYRIVEQIGEGGMATVYKAYQPNLNRYVALKVLSPIHAKQPDFGERFRREAEAIANLNHPNILPVFDFGQEGDHSFIAMRYVQGARTLQAAMRTPLDLAQAVELIGQVAAALDHAHQHGVIHRDVKPSNVLIDDNWALLTDFGLAKITEASVKLTGSGVGVGTPAYMSPEQGQGLESDHRTDIYSLGIVLFEMLTGQIPHDAETPFAIVLKRMTEPLPLPRSINPDIPEAVEQVILKALAREPEDRFVSAAEMAAALREAAASEIQRPIIESAIRESYGLIQEHEEVIRLSDQAKAKQRSRQQIETGWQSIEEHLPEHDPLPGRAIPRDIAQIADQAQSWQEKLDRLTAQATFGTRQEQRAYRNRQKMLKLVHDFWIENVLEKSLHGAAMIELGMEERAEAVGHPWDMVLQMERQTRALSPGTKIIDVFDEMDGSLLILGEPGSGKTTMLLELARDLIARAQDDPASPMPIVFCLSSWAQKRESLETWLVEELSHKYNIPRKIAKPWADGDDLLLLLDSLDEIKEDARDDCVEAINAFRQDHLVSMVVCSRTEEYDALSARLKLQGAVVLQPLAPEQIDRHLECAGEPFAAVRETLKRDPHLREMAQSPLMLSVLMLAYKGFSTQDLACFDDVDACRNHTLNRYVQQMFQRRSQDRPYSPAQTVHWLSWLAQEMVEHKRTILLLEEMQPDWIPAPGQQLLCRVLAGLLVGLVSGLVGGLVLGLALGPVSGLVNGLVLGLIFVLLFGLGAYRTPIKPIEALKWSWRGAAQGLGSTLVWFLGATLMWVMCNAATGTKTGVNQADIWESLKIALFSGLLSGLVRGLSIAEMDTKTVPNQAIWRSLRNALLGGLLLGLASGQWIGLLAGLVLRLFLGLFFGLVFGLCFGGLAAIKHFSLRLLLVHYDYAPWNYARFLDYCAERIFLRKVGGGYIFVHRLLMEHFASLGPVEWDARGKGILSTNGGDLL